MIIAAAAVGLTAPSPAMSFRLNDYPQWALHEGASAASVIRVVVDPKGKVLTCSTVHEFGNPRLAKDVCSIIKRKRLRPATLRDGQRVHTFLDTFISLYLPDTDQGRKMMDLHKTVRMAPDAELSVNKLPDGNSADVGILVAYDEAGKVTDCGPSEKEKEVTLAGIACGQRTLFDNFIQKDLSGQPVSYVTTKKVRFTVSPQAK